MKESEIGSEANPAAFLDTLLALTAEWGRVLAPWGSIAIELGDSYAGSGGAGGDYNPGGLREGQDKFEGTGYTARQDTKMRKVDNGAGLPGGGISNLHGKKQPGGTGWPRPKCMALIPQLYATSLAYGRNILTGGLSARQLLEVTEILAENLPDITITELLEMMRSWTMQAQSYAEFEPWLVRNVIVWHRCLDIDATVYVRTPTGDRPMRLLHLHQQFAPGKFQLWNGEKWTKVVGTSARSTDDAIELTFRNGERISCTRDHRWPIVDKQEARRADELTVGDVVPWTRLPARDDARTPVGLPDDIGWLAGLFLADGSFDSRGRIQIACNVKDALTTGARLAAIAEQYDGTCSWYNQEGNSATCVVRSDILVAVIRRYVSGDNARNKHLSINVWNRTDAFLESLLLGYLAGDGHWDEPNQRWRIVFTDNIWLARDLRAVAARLGIELYLRRARRSNQVGHWVQGLPFLHRGSLRFAAPGETRYQPGQIRTITESKRSSFIDIAVEDEPHTFALSSGLLTHNSNPAVGALADKFRPSTSYITVATRSKDRWFDLTAVRGEPSPNTHARLARGIDVAPRNGKSADRDGNFHTMPELATTAGAPPLDAWFDEYDGTNDLWNLTTQPSSLAHYAMWPARLAERLILSMCPLEVCTVCGEPRRRIEGRSERYAAARLAVGDFNQRPNGSGSVSGNRVEQLGKMTCAENITLGWSDCGCYDRAGFAWKPGLVLDPFAGTGTTLCIADIHGRDAIGIDIDARNRDLMPRRMDECKRALYGTTPELPGQQDLFAEVPA